MRSFRRACGALVVALLLTSSVARAQQTTFQSGSLIIPMDVDYQNAGMLRAYGLLYQLLLNGVPVSWCILPGKTLYQGTTQFPSSPGNSVDFVASATDVNTPATIITNHGYRGGPFVIDSSNAAAALPIIKTFIKANPSVAVHQATASFMATISRQLVNAPNIGINADGNECIAFGYLNAAGIPDSKGQSWPSGMCKPNTSYPGYPDIMSPAQVAGPTTTSHSDGALFGPTGLPRYCQLMSMHWDVNRGAADEETIAEMKQFLSYPTHLFAECQAVNQIEDSANGHFATTDNLTGEPQKSTACFDTPDNGLCAAKKPMSLTLFNSDLPFAQFDGAFQTTDGSEASYGWAPGSSYFNNGIVMMRDSTASSFGVADLWMTGTVKNQCTINAKPHGIQPQQTCAAFGKFSYLGGHMYTTDMPILQHPQSQGVHLFLNSLFEAACTTADGQPTVSISKSAPATTTNSLVTFEIDWGNGGPGIAVAAKVTDALPAGASFVSATNGGTASAGTVTWSLGDLGASVGGSVFVTVQLASYGTYNNTATISYTVGNSARSVVSNQTSTVYSAPPDMAFIPDMAGALCVGVTCTPSTNPCQTTGCDPASGMCVTTNIGDGAGCSTGNKCILGQTCTGGTCGGGTNVQCSVSSNPCQTNSCDPAQGCVTNNVGDGTSCASGDMCVAGLTCTSGVCAGGMSVMCPASLNPCEASTCAPSTGCGFVALADGTACPSGSACVTGTTCTSGVCGGGSGTVCPPPSAPCTLSTCDTTNGCGTAFAIDGTDPNGDCASVGSCMNACNGAGACQRNCQVGGGTCGSDNSVCSTGNCVDGVCCDTTCSGTCMACNVSGHGGMCSPVPDGTDPSGECGAGQVCDGSGGCRAIMDMAMGGGGAGGGGGGAGAGGSGGGGGGAGAGGSGGGGGSAGAGGSGGGGGAGSGGDLGGLGGADDLAGVGGGPGSGGTGAACASDNDCQSGLCVDNSCAAASGAGGSGGAGGASPSGCGCAIGGAEPRTPNRLPALVGLLFGLALVRTRRRRS